MRGHRTFSLVVAFIFPMVLCCSAAGKFLSPSALVVSPSEDLLYVACQDGAKVQVLNTKTWGMEREIKVRPAPSGLALTTDGKQLVVTCAGPESSIQVFETSSGKLIRSIRGRHTAGAPVIAANNQILYVCNRFENSVSAYDLATGKERGQIKVSREPVAAALTLDGRHLLVANHLISGPADGTNVCAVVSVIDTSSQTVIRGLSLPNGSSSVQDLEICPDGNYAVVTHVLSRYQMPTTQLDRGWMNTNAKTIIDLRKMEVLVTVLLDSIDRGAANPWGLAFMKNSRRLAVALAGTHQVCVVDFPKVLQRIERIANKQTAGLRKLDDVPNDLSFLVGISERYNLPEGNFGPRAMAVVGHSVVCANYFSDTLAVFDLRNPEHAPKVVSLGAPPQMDEVRRGELYFNDATICFQGWQTCASCHPGEARVDGLNWDLLNDGIGNPKNTKSMLLSHRTPPAMSSGIRDSAEIAVRSGVRHILFTVQPPEVYQALDSYLKALKPVPSPFLEKGKLSPAARRGEKIFKSSKAACASCHPGPLFTDMEHYDVGTASIPLDTPTLVEIWRTGPYLHNGSATTLREVLTTANPDDKHGGTSHLSPAELSDLELYLLSL